MASTITLAAARLAMLLLSSVAIPAVARTVSIDSPDRTISAVVSDDGGHLTYRVRMGGHAMLGRSALGIRADGVEFGNGVTLGKVARGTVNDGYPFMGGHRVAVNHARLASIAATAHGRPFTIDVHVANDGVGVRLRLPARAGRHVEADRSSWRFAAADPTVWATTLGMEYEHVYDTHRYSALGNGRYGLPLTTRIAGRWMVISEAAQVDYGDLAVQSAGDGALHGVLYADPEGWTTDREVVQPWRVTILARDLTGLVNTTLVQNLNPPAPPALAQATWIQPGKSTWQWLAVGAPLETDQHQWVDWTRRLGFRYYLVDEGWAEWKHPWETLADTVRYADSQGVKTWLWVDSGDVFDPAARRAYFRRAASIGIAGVKIDFPKSSGRAWSNWYPDAARDAAAERLMVDFHGATKPTGIERTWPNILTREGVRGHEWHMTRYQRVLPPSHDTILPFSRYVVGPGDYTPTVFDPKELQGNTWARELAGMVIFTSPFLTVGGHPRTLLDNPARDVVMAIPPVWDQTVVLPGSEPGRRVAFARRSGSDWFVAVINGGTAASMTLPLDFLKRQRCTAVTLRDTARPDAYDRAQQPATEKTRLAVTMAPAGGFVAWLHGCTRD